ncbi:OPT oligopeptide transporter [Punctularia strigosozonata HHB-11173 SS5]|uniref:OPT oligopeptide transporter n=1 Tax=Punctularia strigosozonata (strain HHB-11173) TaxID=741275 RepID=UPI0004416B96|nr:OPT oligopeptide transporter [Punctularia strigosozonata HHB-11173 SS5]EIN08007.1 OPT oligopeptide transporter [Punctularia strigosozonata HHB-11173 SS5]
MASEFKDLAPVVPPPYHPDSPKRTESDIDEKGSIIDEKHPVTAKDLKHVALESDVGDVFEGPRAIDLGADGKERPIETDADYSTRLLSLEDDPSLPIFTFRMWFLALGLSCFGSVLGQIFYFRPQTVSVSQLFLQIIAYILGKAMEEVIPGPHQVGRWKTPDNAFWRFMNGGPFNLKEHVAITIMAATASDSALAISIFAAQDLYYNVVPNAGVGIFTLIGSQLIGYGMAGIMRVFLVYPTYAVYPQLVPTVQLFDALHRGKSAILQKKRLRFFWAVFIAIFVWEWFPEYIAPTLTGVSIFCLADQKSAWFTRIFGGAAGNEGLGAFSLCFDWAYVGSGGGSIGSLFTPLSTQLSLYGGCAVCMIAFCACYAQNVWHAQNFPFLTQLLFYENGTEYDQLLILNDDYTLNYTKLAEQGLPWYAASQLLYKISRTMYIGAAVTHFILWHSKSIYGIIKKARTEECDDPHYQKMKVYKEVPWYWYVAIFVATIAMALATSYTAHSGLPWWGLFVALIFATAFVPVIGTLYCTVGYSPSIENLVQMVGGAIIPGKPVANMYFTLYGYNSVSQSLNLLRDLKLGQYTKLPPRVTFAVQTIGTIIGGVLNYVIMRTVLSSQRDILLDVQGSNVWSGQQVQSYNSDAIAWGALGKPLYATGTRYGFVPYMLLAGLGFPIPFWWLHKKYPNFGWNNVFTPILVAELGYLSVGINSSVFTSFALAIFSQWYLRKYRATWFRKYNFLLSAALDGGTQVMVFVWTFAVGGGSGTVHPFPTWALNPTGNPDYCKRLT